MPKLFDWPQIWLAVFITAVWGVDQMLPLHVFGIAGDVGGGMLILIGLGLMALAVFEMGRARTPVIPRRAPLHLVTSGVFRLSRNPIYLGDVAILLGVCLILDTLLGAVLVPLFVWTITVRFIEGEEAGLTRAFGAAYLDWSARVRRWV
jgi:protein-S-isoprenylcysteine O-methyltransferase Ste14